jgi:hypothetical protein
MDWLLSQGLSFIPAKYQGIIGAIAVIIVVADHVAAQFGWINGNSSAQVFFNGISGFLNAIIKKEGINLGQLAGGPAPGPAQTVRPEPQHGPGQSEGQAPGGISTGDVSATTGPKLTGVGYFDEQKP